MDGSTRACSTSSEFQRENLDLLRSLPSQIRLVLTPDNQPDARHAPLRLPMDPGQPGARRPRQAPTSLVTAEKPYHLHWATLMLMITPTSRRRRLLPDLLDTT